MANLWPVSRCGWWSVSAIWKEAHEKHHAVLYIWHCYHLRALYKKRYLYLNKQLVLEVLVFIHAQGSLLKIILGDIKSKYFLLQWLNQQNTSFDNFLIAFFSNKIIEEGLHVCCRNMTVYEEISCSLTAFFWIFCYNNWSRKFYTFWFL
jgi:hypothetical protein